MNRVINRDGGPRISRYIRIRRRVRSWTTNLDLVYDRLPLQIDTCQKLMDTNKKWARILKTTISSIQNQRRALASGAEEQHEQHQQQEEQQQQEHHQQQDQHQQQEQRRLQDAIKRADRALAKTNLNLLGVRAIMKKIAREKVKIVRCLRRHHQRRRHQLRRQHRHHRRHHHH